MRRIIRAIVTGALTGALVLGVAWATSGLLPVGGTDDDDHATQVHDHALQEAVEEAGATAQGDRLPEGLFRVGASKVSIAPVPINEGGRWIRHDRSEPADGTDTSDGDMNCSRFEQEDFEDGETRVAPLAKEGCLRTFDAKWATGVDETSNLGLYARSLAISNGETTIAFATIDAVSWFYGYEPRFCPDDPDSPFPNDTCGSRAIAESLSAELGIPAKNFVISATHTHASPDTTSDIPAWYYQQVRDAIKQAIRESVGSMQLATLETGSIPAKAFNTDRRIVTRAIPDYELNWMRAVAAPPGPDASGGNPGSYKPGETITTLVNYAVHPTISSGNRDFHSGLVGHLEERLAQHWGGATLFVPGGLGDQTVHRPFGRRGIGYGLADLVVTSQGQSAYTLQSNEIVALQEVIQVPSENHSLFAANKAGVFVRDTTIPGPHASGPAHSHQQKADARGPSCVSSGPVSAMTPVGGIRIGTPGPRQGDPGFVPGDQGDALVIMQAPGEIFSSISAITKDYLSRARNVMVLGLANDHLGYIIPAEQYDVRSANAAGVAQPSINTFNYEESLSTGRCTGDQVQNTLLEIGESLDVLGIGERTTCTMTDPTSERRCKIEDF